MASGDRKVGLGLCIAAVILAVATIAWISVPPKRDGGAPAGSGRRTETPPFEIRIVHQDDPCGDRRAGKPCRDDSHWSVQRDGDLRREANRARSGPGDSSTSERQVVIRGPETSPWGLIQRIMNEAAKVGIYRIDWALLEREKSSSAVQAWLPSRRNPAAEKEIDLAEIRVFMKWFPDPGITVRKVGNRGMVDSDEDLMAIVLQHLRDYRSAGIVSPPVLIDPTPDVLWRDVLHIVELCRKQGVDAIEFAPPPFGQR